MILCKSILSPYCKAIKANSIEQIFECVIIFVCINKKTINLIGIYHSPNTDNDLFFTQLDSVLSKFHNATKNKSLILCGDLNINLLNESNDQAKLLDIVNSYNLSLANFQPTRLFNNSCTLINHFFVNSPIDNINLDIP
jgi:uncharacterized protein YejL (UPF0352 family)